MSPKEAKERVDLALMALFIRQGRVSIHLDELSAALKEGGDFRDAPLAMIDVFWSLQGKVWQPGGGFEQMNLPLLHLLPAARVKLTTRWEKIHAADRKRRREAWEAEQAELAALPKTEDARE